MNKEKKPRKKRARKKAPGKAPIDRRAQAKPAEKSKDSALVKFDPLQRYLSEISQFKLLTREQEKEFGNRVQQNGDQDAAYIMVTSNLRLVVKIALEFQRIWMQNLLDLIQEGNIGLMQAVRKFDPYKNVKFSYYASFWIKAYILKFIMDNWRLVKIGTTQGQRKLFFKLKKEKQKLIDEGFDPKPKLLSERLGVSEREIVDMDQRLDSWDISLDAPLKDDSDTERIEFLSTEETSVEDQVARKEMDALLHEKIAEFRQQMTEREQEIFDTRIFSDTPATLQEIGDRYNISRERVRQVEKNIIKKMREYFKRKIHPHTVKYLCPHHPIGMTWPYDVQDSKPWGEPAPDSPSLPRRHWSEIPPRLQPASRRGRPYCRSPPPGYHGPSAGTPGSMRCESG